MAVPAVVDAWTDDAQGLAVLAMAWLDLGSPDAGFGERLGEALGALHAADIAEAHGRFGWRRDNFVGSTPQCNTWSGDGGLAGWIAFFGERRLVALSERLGGSHAGLARALEAVTARLADFFDDGHVPRPSLIHGDLWSGNWGQQAGGTPVIYDPAVSCSDAEAELAMMSLFGGPPAGFWPAYLARTGRPAPPERRLRLYQLYHLANHALLFGGGYVRQSLLLAQSLLRRA